MSREARRKDPALPPRRKLELQDGHFTIRAICVCLAIVVAALAFGTVINSLISTKTGWQKIELDNPEVAVAGDFLLCYNIGQTDLAAKEELNALSACYAQLLDQGYRALSNTAQESCGNLYTLNTQPNTAVVVDELLYRALETVEASGSRFIYFAPLMGQYRSLFYCTYDEEAEQFDPERSEDAAAFAREIAAYALDPEAVQLKLLPENTVRLEISPAYLSYCRENQVDCYVDLGLLLNAFLCDVVADGLQEKGFVNGYVTSFDGYTRALCADEFGLNVFDQVEGQPRQLGTVVYHTPGTIVSFRSFPILDMDRTIYYSYRDGTIRAPYLNDQGLLHCAVASLNTFSETLSAAQLALRTLEAYTGTEDTFPTLEDLSWVAGENQEMILHGEEFTLAE